MNLEDIIERRGQGSNVSIRKLNVNRSASGALTRTESHRSVASMIEYDSKGKAVDNLQAEKKVQEALRVKRKAVYESKDLIPRRLRFFKFLVVEKEEKMKRYIISTLASNVLFKEFTKSQLKLVAGCMRPDSFRDTCTIITEGDHGDRFYLVISGTFIVLHKGKKIGEARGGDVMGEMAVYYNTSQENTYRSKGEALCYSLDGITLRQIVAKESRKNEVEVVLEALKKVTIFKEAQVTEEQYRALVDHVFRVKFDAGDTIISKGDVGDIMYLIVDGFVRVTKIGQDSDGELEFGPGDYFGERSLLNNDRRGANVVAVENVECLALNRDSFVKVFGSSLDTILRDNIGIRMLRGFPSLQSLDETVQQKFMEALFILDYTHEDRIVSRNTPCDGLYIIRSGVVEKSSGTHKVIERLTYGDIFGHDVNKDGAKFEHDYNAVGAVSCFVLTRAAIARLPTEIDVIWQRGKFVATEEVSYNFADFELKEIVGQGGFGIVRIAQHKSSNRMYAIKIMKKKEIIELGQQQNVFREKEILAECEHPFILKLHKTFQDERNLYILTDYITGGTLDHRMGEGTVEHSKVGVQRADVVFYAACVASALEYLHAKSIVYRDLKLENVMIDKTGYAKLIDFGFAKKVQGKTMTFCGTPEYMAPEIVKRESYDYLVDLWSFGVLVYEMTEGVSPFFSFKKLIIFQNIRDASPFFSKRFPAETRSFAKALLQKVPGERLGANDPKEIREHPFFQELDWNALLAKKILPPWVPGKAFSVGKIPDPEDSSHGGSSDYESLDPEVESMMNYFMSF